MKKLSKRDQYFLEMLETERKYRSKTGGDDCDEPYITPILFSISDTLRFLVSLLGCVFGVLLTLLACRL